MVAEWNRWTESVRAWFRLFWDPAGITK